MVMSSRGDFLKWLLGLFGEYQLLRIFYVEGLDRIPLSCEGATRSLW